MKHHIFFPAFILWVLAQTVLTAQSGITPGILNRYESNEACTEIAIPYTTQYSYIYLVVKGGDGGKAREAGGSGALAYGFFAIGNGAGEIRPGSTLRLIPGKQGKSGAMQDNGGGGGGGSAVLVLGPNETDWYKSRILLVAGGGGGSGTSKQGSSANTGEAGLSGVSGDGSSLNNQGETGGAGKGNGSGDGGGSAFDISYCTIEGISCKPRVAAGAGYPGGAKGSNTSCGSRHGGWGFGGGGASSEAGGGGGGYSGGSAGGNSEYHGSGGGGGGGSYVNPDFSIVNPRITASGTADVPQNGYILYGLLNPYSAVHLAANQAKCFDTGSEMVNGANVQLFACNGATTQKWVVDGPNLRLANDTGKCLDLSGSNTANGTNIQLMDCQPGNRNQVWRYDVAYQAIRSGLDFNKCVDLDHSNTADGTNIRLWDCNKTGAQKWILDGIPSALPTGSNNSIRMAMVPGKCIDISQSGTANGTNIQLYDCNGTNAQHFVFDSRAIKMQSSPNKCIDLRQSSDGNGTNIQLYDCNGTKAQQWIYDAFAKAFRSAVNNNKCIDVDHSNLANGANIQLWDCNGTLAQQFVIGQ